MKKMQLSNSYFKLILLLTLLFNFKNHLFSQEKSIVLGRPTNTSVTASILFDMNVNFYISYGIQTGNYTNITNTFTNVPNTPDEVELSNLLPNTQYYYTLNFKPTNSSTYTISQEYTFHTQRAPGDEFVFTLEADEHLYDHKGVANMYNVTLANEAQDKPDFMLSLGDIFGDDHNPHTITSYELDTLHRHYRSFLGKICHSIPFYVCLGNHEGEMNYYLGQNPPNNLAAWGTQWRNFYYPNPSPNSFYSGNQEIEPFGIGSPKNYYSWTWGDALFVVLDVYRYQSISDTTAKPKNWDWTIGQTQYDWLKSTLEGSTSKYKFVFAHHIRGQGRGGVTNAKLFEWGGYEQDGTTYTFPVNRPNMAKPIHNLFVDNGVNIFFQGHDHVFAHEVMDGVTYQALPMPSDSTYMIGKLANADAYTSDTLDGTGHIRVTVNGGCTQVDYVKAYLPADTLSGLHHNGEIGFSYTIGDCSINNIFEKDITEQIKVYPNPAKDKITVTNLNSTEHLNSIELLDTFGNIIFRALNTEIDTKSISNGVYFLRINSDKSTTTKKIVINH